MSATAGLTWLGPPGARAAPGPVVPLYLTPLTARVAVRIRSGWALSKGLRHSEALAETAALRAYAPPGETDRAHFERTLLLEESRLLLCDGQDAAATVALERGLELNSGGGGGGGGGGGPLDESWSPAADVAAQFSVKMNDLLQLYRWQGREAEAERTARAAMRLGGWPSTTQRPLHTHDRSLSARGSPHAGKPWLTPPAHDQTTERAASSSSAVAASAAVALGLGGFLSELEALTSVLRAEYEESLLLLGQRDDGHSGSGGEGGGGGYGLMVPQTECLHAPGAAGKGNWLYFPCQGDGGGGSSSCSHQHTPKACELLPALAAKHDVVLVRFGYSMLEAGGWIRPHVGPSNAQLKIHLGLKVPPQQQADTTTAAAASAASAHTAAADGNDDADGGAAAADVAGGGGAAGRGSVSAREHCPATFTIAGQMRRWVEGRALLFDDSYEHEVRNGCEESRVVMQLVIAHPAA